MPQDQISLDDVRSVLSDEITLDDVMAVTQEDRPPTMAGMPEEGSMANQPPPAAAPSRTRPYPVMGAPGVDPKWAGAFAAARGSQGPTFVPTGGMNEQPAEPAGPGLLATTAAKIVPRAERAIANIEALGRGAVEGARRVAAGEITNLPELLLGGVPVEPWNAKAPRALGLNDSLEMRQVAAQGGGASDAAAVLLGMPFDLADPANAYENAASAVGGAALARAAAPVIRQIETLAGPVVSRVVIQVLENGTPGAAIAGLQHAEGEDWQGDPWGAAGRTLTAAGIGAAAGTAAGTAMEVASGRMFAPSAVSPRTVRPEEMGVDSVASAPHKDGISYAEPTQPQPAGNTAEVTGKQAETTAQPAPVPERPATVAAQVELLTSGKRRAVLVTPGEAMTEIPAGMRQARSTAGTFIYDPERIGLAEIRSAVKDDRIGDVLEYGISKKPEPGTEAGTVVVRNPAGEEVQAVVTDAQSLPAVEAAARRVAQDGDTVTLEHPGQVIAERLETPQNQSTVLRASGNKPQNPDTSGFAAKAAPEPAGKPAELEPAPLGKVEEGNKQPGGLAVSVLHEAEPTTKPEAPEAVAAQPKDYTARRQVDLTEERGPVTSARNAMMAEDRAALGLDALDGPERRSWQAALDTAVADKVPERALGIAAEVNAKPRALSDVETAGLVHRASTLKTEHRAIGERISKASDEASRLEAVAELTRVEAEFDALSTALQKTGTEQGRALASRKLALAEDYSLVAIKTRAKAAKGRALSPEETAKLTELSNKLEAASSRLTELEKTVAEAKAERAIRRHSAARRADPKTRDANYSALLGRAKDLLAKGCN